MNAQTAYPLATGPDGATRLELLHRVYRAESERLLWDAGLKPGMRVADIGCGIGTVSRWLAGQVGASGHVCGVDASPAQIEIARAHGTSGITPEYRTCDVYYLEALPTDFDLVYCRLLLCHLDRPRDALAQIIKRLKPGGIFVCEELDLTPESTVPPVAAYDQLVADGIRAARARNVDYNIGRQIPGMLENLGISVQLCRLHSPGFFRGEEKYLDERSILEEAEQRVIRQQMTQARFNEIKTMLSQATGNDSVLVWMSRLAQIAGRKN